VRSTHDIALRETFVAGRQLRLVEPLVAPYLGVGTDGESIAILMPDLSGALIEWERPAGEPTVPDATLGRVLEAVARLHTMPWADYRPSSPDWGWPWTPLAERLLLLSRPAAERYRAEGVTVGERFLSGWDAFDRRATTPAQALVETLSNDPAPLIAALGRLPSTGLHGDLKLANVAVLDDGRVALIDWGLMTLAPVAVELGWLAVSNSAVLGIEPDEVMARYRDAVERAAGMWLPLGTAWGDAGGSGATAASLPPRGLAETIGDWDAQRDLAWIVGLLMRGWRKGLDAEANATLGSGVAARDDLAWWSERAVEAASRRLR
jgi:hypothetical protein